MSRSILFAAAWTMISGLAASADQPQPDAEKPPYERLLQGDDAKLAAELKQKIDAAEQADKYDEAIELTEQLLELRTNVQGADHWETVNETWALDGRRRQGTLPSHERAAWHKVVQGGFEAVQLASQSQFAAGEPLLQEFRRSCEQILGTKHPETAISYANLARNLEGQQKYPEAVELCRKALDIRFELLSEKHPDTAAAYNQLAQIYQAQGKYAEALPLYQKSLDIRLAVLGEKHSDTAGGYNNLAGILGALGKYAEAQPACEKALALTRELLGEKHLDTATRYNNLAMNLNHQGKHVEAQVLLQKALDLRLELHGEKHPYTAYIYDNLAGNLDAQGKYAEAQPLHQKALDLIRELLGEKHTDTATRYNNLAMNLNHQGKHVEAQVLLQKALDLRLELLGEKHPSTAVAYNNVAANLDDQGRYADAKVLYEKSLKLNIELLGEKHPNTATSLNNLGRNLNDQGKFADAQPLLEKALDLYQELLGEKHPYVAIGYANLAQNLEFQGKYADAQRASQKALDIRLERFGKKHPDTSLSYHNLGSNLFFQRKYVEAQPFFETALVVSRELLGEKHVNTAGSYRDLARSLGAQEKFADAQPLVQKALDIFRELLGECHPATMNTYSALALNLNAQGEQKQAEAVLIQAAAAFEVARLNLADRGLERAIFGDLQSPYSMLAATRARLNSLEPAWVAAEANLGRGLTDEVAVGGATSLTMERTTLATRLNQLQDPILQLATNPRPTDAERKALVDLLANRASIEAELTNMAAALSQREVAPLNQVQTAIPDSAALILWVDVSPDDGVSEHWGCAVRASGEPRWERLPGTGPQGKWTDDDDSQADKLRAALVSETLPVGALDILAHRLSTQRLAPLAKHLNGVKTLYVAPVNQMAGIPIEVLTREYTISYVPSGTFLARLSDRSPASGGGLLALGDPVFTRPDSEAEPTPASELPTGGLLITQVASGGAADKARLKSGDVLVRYGETELNSVEQLTEAMQAQADAKEVPITVWREGVKQPFTRIVPLGKLGVALSKEPAREAIASRRQCDRLLAGLQGGDWNELPGTRVELTQLAKLFGPQATTLVESAASEQALERLRNDDDAGLSQFRYLHFATHGEANDVRAFESVLILAQDTLPADRLPRAGEPFINGQLSANEVLEFWHLNADLVTLSACETALGRKGGGDGLLGFAQAFLKAGSRAVCLSLWKVDDTATSLLMTRFYKNLLGKRESLDGPMPKAAALAEAKQWLRELSAEEALKLTAAATNGVVRGTRGKGEKLKLAVTEVDANKPVAKDAKPFAHPRFWSAFILIGDPN